MAKRKAKTTNGINTNGVTPNVDTRNRIQMRFWLDANKDNELQMIKDLHHFKKGRKFSKVIRDALRLMFALLLGEIGVLVELFPGIVAAIQQEARSELLAENAALKQRVIGLQAVIEESDDYISELEAENDRLQKQPSATGQASPDAIQAQLDRIERQLIAQGNTPITSVHDDTPAAANGATKPIGLKSLQPVSGGNSGPKGPKPLNIATAVPGPQFDDDDMDIELDIKRDESASMRSTMNFINSITALANSKSSGDTSGLSARQRANLEGDNQ